MREERGGKARADKTPVHLRLGLLPRTVNLGGKTMDSSQRNIIVGISVAIVIVLGVGWYMSSKTAAPTSTASNTSAATSAGAPAAPAAQAPK